MSFASYIILTFLFLSFAIFLPKFECWKGDPYKVDNRLFLMSFFDQSNLRLRMGVPVE